MTDEPNELDVSITPEGAEAPVAPEGAPEPTPAEPDPTPAPAAPAEPVAAPAPAGEAVPQPEAEAPQADAKEIADGKAFALLSYVLSLFGIPFFIVPLIMRNNEFSLYHAKQCLMVWLLFLVGSVISVPLMAICIGVILLAVVGIFDLVLLIMGIVNASGGVMKPLPLIGGWGEDWFKGITKA